MWRQQCLRGTTALLYGTWVVWRVYGSKYLQLKLRCRSLDLGPKKSCVSPLSSRSVHSLYMDVSFVHRVRAVRAPAGDPGVSQCRGGCGGWRADYFLRPSGLFSAVLCVGVDI